MRRWIPACAGMTLVRGNDIGQLSVIPDVHRDYQLSRRLRLGLVFRGNEWRMWPSAMRLLNELAESTSLRVRRKVPPNRTEPVTVEIASLRSQ